MENSELRILIESQDFACSTLRVKRFVAREAISRLYEYEVEVVVMESSGPTAKDFLGASLTIVLDGVGRSEAVRRFHGLVCEVSDGLEGQAGLRVYSLRVVPRAYALAMVEQSESFINLSVPAVLAQKIDAIGLDKSTSFQLQEAYDAREFIVQYQESDLAFVSRLAEHLGLSFYFEHDDTTARLVFTDHAAGFGRVEGGSVFRSQSEGVGVFSLTEKRKVIQGFHSIHDYNYRMPAVDLSGDYTIPNGFAGGCIEYGAHHKSALDGATLARIRGEAALSEELIYSGKSYVPTLGAGLRLKLDEHPELGSVDLCLTQVVHVANQTVAGFDDGGPAYENTFFAIPADRTFRPARVTPRPRISGLVTGIIDAGLSELGARVAPIDASGHYLVRFLFDTTHPGDRPVSRPVRMLQNHAGEGYGTHFPLKGGTEVAIAFIGGDPDRPVIVGALPNALAPSPVTNANPGLHRIRTSSGITIDFVE